MALYAVLDADFLRCGPSHGCGLRDGYAVPELEGRVDCSAFLCGYWEFGGTYYGEYYWVDVCFFLLSGVNVLGELTG